LGNPISAYLFQGATIKCLSSRLSLNYEWNLGLTYGWKSYDEKDHPENRVIGSKLTAYLDADIYLRWMLSRQFDLNIGLTASHFSNGNTSMPNAGLNVASAKLSLAYYINRPESSSVREGPLPLFEKHWSTDVVVFGGWKKRGAETALGSYTLSDTYGVVGVNVNPMYNLNHWLNVGASLDLYYDHSANLKAEEPTAKPVSDPASETESQNESEKKEEVVVSTEAHLQAPSWYRQVTAGLSVRAEYVMPYFTINFGIGHNLINAGSAHFRGFYEILALKAALTPKVFLHIGYSLYSFQYPNNLMLGIGYRFGGRRK
jgi:opacity protein-like surface antigen